MKGSPSTWSENVARKRLGLDWTPARIEGFLNTVKVVKIKRLAEPYPIDDFYVAGTPIAKEQWDACMSCSCSLIFLQLHFI
jgi:hypothetical protein